MHLTPWQKAQVARHENRPHTIDYIHHLIEDFSELKGDRCFGDDQAIIGGIGRFNGQTVMVIGNEKSANKATIINANYGRDYIKEKLKIDSVISAIYDINTGMVKFID